MIDGSDHATAAATTTATAEPFCTGAIPQKFPILNLHRRRRNRNPRRHFH